MRPGHRVVPAVGFERAGPDPGGGEVVRAEAADVDRPEVVRRRAVDDPFGQRHARAATAGDAEGVEAGADEKARDLGRLAEDEVAVRGEALGAVDELLDAGGLERGDAAEGESHHRLEVVEVAVEQGEVEAVGDAGLGPGLRVRLVAAHHQAADLLLVVGEPVRVAQRRQVRRHALDAVGDQVLVLDADQRHVDAGQPADLARPLAGAVDHGFAGDLAPVGDDALDPAVLDPDRGDGGVLADGDAAGAGAAGEGLDDVGRRGLAVGRQVGRADHVVDRHQRPERLRLGGGEELHLEAERAGGGGLAAHLGPALRGAGEAQAAVHLPAGGEAGLRLQPVVEGDRIAEQPRHVGAGAELADEAGGVPGGARRQLVALEQDHVGHAHRAEVVGGGAADDAAADDDDLRRRRQVAHGAFS